MYSGRSCFFKCERRFTGVAHIIGEAGREVVGKRADGELFPMFLSVAEFWVGKERFFSGIVRDISNTLTRCQVNIEELNTEIAMAEYLRHVDPHGLGSLGGDCSGGCIAETGVP